MNMEIYEKTKKNVANALGVDDFSGIAQVSKSRHALMIAKAQGKLKIKCHTKAYVLSAGSPYIMLKLKVDSKGKRIK